MALQSKETIVGPDGIESTEVVSSDSGTHAVEQSTTVTQNGAVETARETQVGANNVVQTEATRVATPFGRDEVVTETVSTPTTDTTVLRTAEPESKGWLIPLLIGGLALVGLLAWLYMNSKNDPQPTYRENQPVNNQPVETRKNQPAQEPGSTNPVPPAAPAANLQTQAPAQQTQTPVKQSLRTQNIAQACKDIAKDAKYTNDTPTILYSDYNKDGIEDAVVGVVNEGTGKFMDVCAYTYRDNTLELMWAMPDSEVMSYGKIAAGPNPTSFTYSGYPNGYNPNEIPKNQVYEWQFNAFLKK